MVPVGRMLLVAVFARFWNLPRLLEDEQLPCATIRLQSSSTVGFTEWVTGRSETTD